MLSPQRVPTPVLIGGLAVLLIGVLTVLTVAEPAVSTSPDRCSRFSTDSRQLALTTSGSGRSVSVIGDSYAAGLGLRDPTRAWTRRIAGQVRVFAFSGSGFAQFSSSCGPVAFFQRAEGAVIENPAAVVIEGGLNDIGQSERAIRSGFRQLIAQIGARQILVVGPPRAPSRAKAAVRVDRILRETARRNDTPYLSMIKMRFDYLPDALHLTPDGHTAFGNMVARELRALPRPKPPKS